MPVPGRALKDCLREQMQARGMTTRELARLIGSSHETVRDWTRRGRAAPPLRAFIRIALALDAPEMAELLFRSRGWRVVRRQRRRS